MNIHNSLTKLLLLMALLLSVQLMARPTDDNITIKHGKGETIVKKNPKKVVILDLGTLETYHELGIAVAGVPNTLPEHLADYRADQYVKLGTAKGVNLEAVKALQPDLIIISGRQQSNYDELATVAPTLLMRTETGNFWNSFEQNVKAIAQLHGKEKEAEKRLKALRLKADVVRKRSQSDANKGLVALYVNERFAPNGANSRFGFPFDVLGMKAAIEAPAGGEGKREEGAPKGPTVQEINPDYLFVIDRQAGISGQKSDLASILTNEIKQTNAFKNNKVFSLSGSIWYLSGGGLTSVDTMIQEVGHQVYGLSF